MEKYIVIGPSGRVLTKQPVALWCAERLVSEYRRMFGWSCSIRPS